MDRKYPHCCQNDQIIEELERKVMDLLNILEKIADGPHDEIDRKCQPYCLACRATKAIKDLA